MKATPPLLALLLSTGLAHSQEHPDGSYEAGKLNSPTPFAGGQSVDAGEHYDALSFPTATITADLGSRLIESSQAQDGNRYLWLDLGDCQNTDTSVGWSQGATYQICAYVAAGSAAAGTIAAFEIPSFVAATTNVIMSPGGYVDSEGRFAFAIDANSGWSDTALDSDGIPWQKICLTFTMTQDVNGSDDLFRISNQGAQPLLLDNTSISQIPEPSSALLLTSGLLAFALRRKRA